MISNSGRLIDLAVFCNNRMCPFDDCEKKWKHQMEFDEDGDPPTVLDLQCACMRVTKYLAEQITKAGRERQGK